MAHDLILELGRRWAEAEQNADTKTLDTFLADDFTAIGPRGFVLTRQQWLERYESGVLKNELFRWDDVSVREYGDDAAVAVGMMTQKTTHQGQEVSGRFRLSQVLVQQGDRWVIAHLQLSGPIPDMPSGRQ